jgi:putative DNA primase/helicase
MSTGAYTNASGDLIMQDKKGDDVVVAEGGFVVTTAMSHQEGSVEWKLHCSHHDFDGNIHKTTHTIADVHTSPKKVLRNFLSLGLRLVPGKGRLFIEYLLSNLPRNRCLSVLRGGWLEASWVYVQPNWVAGDAGEPVHLELEQNCPTVSSMTTAGSLLEWQVNVAAPLRGNNMAMLCIIFSFLGPLLKIVGMEGGGVCLVGPSSIGKTTGLQVGASVFGCGSSPASESGRSYVQPWNLTSNALEGIAAAHTDALTPLDEIGLYTGGDLGSDLYLLAGGRGKGAMDSQRRLKNVRTWTGNVLVTSEVTTLEAIECKGGRAKSGMLVRLIDIPVINMFPNPPEGMTASEFSNKMKLQCGNYYGTAGRAFVEFLVDQLLDDPESVTKDLRAALDHFTREMIPADATPIQQRAIRRFAAVKLAGHAAVEAGVLPYSVEDVDACVSEVMGTWLTFRPTVTDVHRALVNLQDILLRTGASLPGFQDCNASNPRGFRDGRRGLFAFTDTQLNDATKSGNPEEVAKELRRLGFLFCNEINRLKSKLKISCDTESRYYAVKKEFLSADLQRTDADDTVFPDE